MHLLTDAAEIFTVKTVRNTSITRWLLLRANNDCIYAEMFSGAITETTLTSAQSTRHRQLGNRAA